MSVVYDYYLVWDYSWVIGVLSDGVGVRLTGTIFTHYSSSDLPRRRVDIPPVVFPGQKIYDLETNSVCIIFGVEWIEDSYCYHYTIDCDPRMQGEFILLCT